MIGASQRPLHDNTQHFQETDFHAPGGIQSLNPSKRMAADPRDRPQTITHVLTFNHNGMSSVKFKFSVYQDFGGSYNHSLQAVGFSGISKIYTV
jgi:hypothetical protein